MPDQAKSPTPDQRRKMNAFVREIEKGGALTECAKRAKVGLRTTYKWRDAFPGFDTDVLEAMQVGADAVEQQLWNIATGEAQAKNMAQVTACFGILKARRPDVWRDNYKVEHTGKVVPVEVRFAFDTTPERGSREALAKPRLKLVDSDGG